jgi:hypothetical protein
VLLDDVVYQVRLGDNVVREDRLITAARRRP